MHHFFNVICLTELEIFERVIGIAEVGRHRLVKVGGGGLWTGNGSDDPAGFRSHQIQRHLPFVALDLRARAKRENLKN